VLAAIRDHMNERGYVELETPILQRLTGGAAARPFKTHHHALDRHLFLRIATELYLKRAIVGGFEDVYELGKFFRNEGMSPQHNPEFTMLEWFVSGADYNGVMAFTEELVAGVVERVLGTTKVERDGETIDFATPWKRITLREALLEETGADITELSRDEMAELAGDDAQPDDDWAALADTLQGKLVEPKLTQPTFIYDLPLDIWPLVKPLAEHPKLLCEAFDGIVAGMEITGGGTDINDPVEQRRRFVEQRERQESGAEENPHEHDEEFVRALEYGMLTASGCGLGVDRLMMILSGSKTLRDVILFPSMREAPGE
jgi:lysyl-tRNA synthetase, class II